MDDEKNNREIKRSGSSGNFCLADGQKQSQSAKIKKMAACRSEKSYFPNLVGCKNIKKIFNEPYKFNQFAFFPMKIFVSKATFSVKIMNFLLILFYWRNRHVDVFQITVDFVFVYNNKGVHEHEKTANLQ